MSSVLYEATAFKGPIPYFLGLFNWCAVNEGQKSMKTAEQNTKTKKYNRLFFAGILHTTCRETRVLSQDCFLSNNHDYYYAYL